MRAKWQWIVDRFGALSTRERVLVLVALFAVAYQIGTLVVFDRQLQQIESVTAQIARDNAAVVDANQSLAKLHMTMPEDPNRQLRAAIETLRIEADSTRQKLSDETATLISPQDMARFLEALLQQETGLGLLSLHTLDVQPLVASSQFEGAATSAASERVVVHRHGFEIEFAGGYLATVRYLQALEALPWRFFWDSVEFAVVDYPESIVRLRLHTLSLSEDWIGA